MVKNNKKSFCVTSLRQHSIPLLYGRAARRSQNAEIVTHIKCRLLERAVILINCVPFLNRNFSYEYKCAAILVSVSIATMIFV